jgi:hypothetical protein
MGFRLNRTYALRWDGDLAGLEVDIRSTSVATMREVRAMRVSENEEGLSKILVDHIARWNFEDESGEILPVTVENLLSQEPVVLGAIAREWYLAASGVSAPLDLGSTSSPPSEEVSIPMETL